MSSAREIRDMKRRIVYSDKYYDANNYEYRHVILPKSLARALIPRNKLLSEDEWKASGVTQSRGWIHYSVRHNEPHILLMRRPRTDGGGKRGWTGWSGIPDWLLEKNPSLPHPDVGDSTPTVYECAKQCESEMTLAHVNLLLYVIAEGGAAAARGAAGAAGAGAGAAAAPAAGAGAAAAGAGGLVTLQHANAIMTLQKARAYSLVYVGLHLDKFTYSPERPWGILVDGDSNSNIPTLQGILRETAIAKDMAEDIDIANPNISVRRVQNNSSGNGGTTLVITQAHVMLQDVVAGAAGGGAIAGAAGGAGAAAGAAGEAGASGATDLTVTLCGGGTGAPLYGDDESSGYAKIIYHWDYIKEIIHNVIGTTMKTRDSMAQRDKVVYGLTMETRGTRHMMDLQDDINLAMVDILIDWLIQVAVTFKLQGEVLDRGIDFFMRFLGRDRDIIHALSNRSQGKQIARQKLQLVGCVALDLASKVEEIYAPVLSDWVKMCAGAYTRKDVIQMELLMVGDLDHDFSSPLTKQYINYFTDVLRRSNSLPPMTLSTLTLAAFYLGEMSYACMGLLKYTYAYIGISAVLLAIHLVCGDDDNTAHKLTEIVHKEWISCNEAAIEEFTTQASQVSQHAKNRGVTKVTLQASAMLKGLSSIQAVGPRGYKIVMEKLALAGLTVGDSPEFAEALEQYEGYFEGDTGAKIGSTLISCVDTLQTYVHKSQRERATLDNCKDKYLNQSGPNKGCLGVIQGPEMTELMQKLADTVVNSVPWLADYNTKTPAGSVPVARSAEPEEAEEVASRAVKSAFVNKMTRAGGVNKAVAAAPVAAAPVVAAPAAAAPTAAAPEKAEQADVVGFEEMLKENLKRMERMYPTIPPPDPVDDRGVPYSPPVQLPSTLTMLIYYMYTCEHKVMTYDDKESQIITSGLGEKWEVTRPLKKYMSERGSQSLAGVNPSHKIMELVSNSIALHLQGLLTVGVGTDILQKASDGWSHDCGDTVGGKDITGQIIRPFKKSDYGLTEALKSNIASWGGSPEKEHYLLCLKQSVSRGIYLVILEIAYTLIKATIKRDQVVNRPAVIQNPFYMDALEARLEDDNNIDSFIHHELRAVNGCNPLIQEVLYLGEGHNIFLVPTPATQGLLETFAALDYHDGRGIRAVQEGLLTVGRDAPPLERDLGGILKRIRDYMPKMTELILRDPLKKNVTFKEVEQVTAVPANVCNTMSSIRDWFSMCTDRPASGAASVAAMDAESARADAATARADAALTAGPRKIQTPISAKKTSMSLLGTKGPEPSDAEVSDNPRSAFALMKQRHTGGNYRTRRRSRSRHRGRRSRKGRSVSRRRSNRRSKRQGKKGRSKRQGASRRGKFATPRRRSPRKHTRRSR